MKTPRMPKQHIKLGGYDAKQCLELLRKNLDPAYKEEWKDERDAFTQSIMESGNKYELDIVGPAMATAIRSHVTIDTTQKMSPQKRGKILAEARKKTLVIFEGTRDNASKTLREDLTHVLLENPGKVRVLWNPRLRIWKKDVNGKIVWGNRSSEPDILYRQGTRTTAKPRWGAIDVKWHRSFEGKRSDKVWKISRISSPYLHTSSGVSYEGTPKKADALQLAHYYRTLEFHGLAGKPMAGVIGKPLGGELKVVWLDLTESLYNRRTISAIDLYDENFATALAVAEREVERLSDPTLDPLVGPEWKTDCGTCVWRSTCHDELSVSDHITLLPGVTPNRAKAHYEVGVSEVSEIAKLDTKTAAAIDAGADNLDILITEANSGNYPKTAQIEKILNGRRAASQSVALRSAGIKTIGDLAALDVNTSKYRPTVYNLTNTIDQARVSDYARVRRMTHVFRARGIKKLEIPKAKVEIHVDMENDDHVYLWGVRVVRNERGHSNWTHESFVTYEATDTSEADVTVRFWKFLMKTISDANKKYGKGNVLVFHYTAAEDRCLRHLAEKHAGVRGIPSIKKLEAFIASDVWVDLYPVLTSQLVWPTENLTLKSLAKYVRFFWRDNDPSGSNSVVWYKRAINPNDPESEAFQERIVDYNADDCEATAVLLAWLQQFGKVYNVSRKLTSVEELESRYNRPAVRRIAKSKPKTKASANSK